MTERDADDELDPTSAVPTVGTVGDALLRIRERIDATPRPWDHAVEITAVTKSFGPGVIDLAVAAGCGSIGENYAQELVSKAPAIEAYETGRRPRVDFIGGLQRNKVRQLVGLVDRWCTVDRASLALEIARRADGARVLIQVNATDEQGKGGCKPTEVATLVERCRELGLHVDGLLTVGPTTGPPGDAATGFGLVRGLVDELGLAVCSMGMTADFEIGVSCGATNVRIGSALFGPRPGPIRPVHPEGDERG